MPEWEISLGSTAPFSLQLQSQCVSRVLKYPKIAFAAFENVFNATIKNNGWMKERKKSAFEELDILALPGFKPTTCFCYSRPIYGITSESTEVTHFQ